MNLSKDNNLFLDRLSVYLNDYASHITYKTMNMMKESGSNDLSSYKLLLISYLELEYSSLKYLNYLDICDEKEYMDDPYYKNIQFTNQKYGKWQIKMSKYQPFELFVKNDFHLEGNNLLPDLGFFMKPFYFPAIYENDRLWMSITPNEINTMKEDIKEAKGRVLTFGLGLGYYAYMCARKDDVEKVTVVERDHQVIELFKKFILPKMECKDKIEIIEADAYEYMKGDLSAFDYIFVDIYHDASDGVECFIKTVSILKDNPKLHFWIFDTIKYYL